MSFAQDFINISYCFVFSNIKCEIQLIFIILLNQDKERWFISYPKMGGYLESSGSFGLHLKRLLKQIQWMKNPKCGFVGFQIFLLKPIFDKIRLTIYVMGF